MGKVTAAPTWLIEALGSNLRIRLIVSTQSRPPWRAATDSGFARGTEKTGDAQAERVMRQRAASGADEETDRTAALSQVKEQSALSAPCAQSMPDKDGVA